MFPNKTFCITEQVKKHFGRPLQLLHSRHILWVEKGQLKNQYLENIFWNPEAAMTECPSLLSASPFRHMRVQQ